MFGQELPSYFKNLLKTKVSGTETYDIIVYSDSSNTNVINKEITDQDYPHYALPVRVLSTKINIKRNELYTIEYWPGLSADPTFIIYENTKDSLKSIISLNGETLIIPGNGSIYFSGHTNKMFNIRRKFTLESGSLKEVKQPFYYVGLKTITLKPIELYSDTLYAQKIAGLPHNSNIEVLINASEHYLIKTALGLTGWVKIPTTTIEESPIKGLYYTGD